MFFLDAVNVENQRRPSVKAEHIFLSSVFSTSSIAPIAHIHFNTYKIYPESTSTLGSHVTRSQVGSFGATLACFLQTQFSKQTAFTLASFLYCTTFQEMVRKLGNPVLVQLTTISCISYSPLSLFGCFEYEPPKK